jgi:hypothetical protein
MLSEEQPDYDVMRDATRRTCGPRHLAGQHRMEEACQLWMP